MPENKKGFTLIELLVVVLIIGILSAVAIPRYAKTVETAKANDAMAVVKMIGTTNKMFRLDNGVYTVGPMGDSCSSGCSDDYTSIPDACALIGCKYLQQEKWTQKGYDFETADGDTASSPCGGCNSGNIVACARRDSSGKGSYRNWGYTMDINGEMKACSGSDAPEPL